MDAFRHGYSATVKYWTNASVVTKFLASILPRCPIGPPSKRHSNGFSLADPHRARYYMLTGVQINKEMFVYITVPCSVHGGYR